MCSSHQHYQRQYCPLGLSSTSTLPLIFLSINSVPFYAAFFCSNAWHSFSNTKLDELGLLGSSKAGPYSAAADLPASCCTLTHFTHTMGSVKPHRCSAGAAEQSLAVEASWMSLRSQLCFNTAEGALSTMRLLLKPAAVRLTSRKRSLRNWIQALKIQELCSLGSAIFLLQIEGWHRECTIFFF